MADLGKKISELQETTDLAGLYTIGTDKNTQSKKVSLQFLKEAADYANSQGDYAKEVGDTVAGNVGVNAYPTFSASTQYAAGSVVNYNGKLYRFTSLHPAGAWVGTDAIETSIKAETDVKLTELESDISCLETNARIVNGIHYFVPRIVKNEYCSAPSGIIYPHPSIDRTEYICLDGIDRIGLGTETTFLKANYCAFYDENKQPITMWVFNEGDFAPLNNTDYFPTKPKYLVVSNDADKMVGMSIIIYYDDKQSLPILKSDIDALKEESISHSSQITELSQKENSLSHKVNILNGDISCLETNVRIINGTHYFRPRIVKNEYCSVPNGIIYPHPSMDRTDYICLDGVDRIGLGTETTFLKANYCAFYDENKQPITMWVFNEGDFAPLNNTDYFPTKPKYLVVSNDADKMTEMSIIIYYDESKSLPTLRSEIDALKEVWELSNPKDLKILYLNRYVANNNGFNEVRFHYAGSIISNTRELTNQNLIDAFVGSQGGYYDERSGAFVLGEGYALVINNGGLRIVAESQLADVVILANPNNSETHPTQIYGIMVDLYIRELQRDLDYNLSGNTIHSWLQKSVEDKMNQLAAEIDEDSLVSIVTTDVHGEPYNRWSSPLYGVINYVSKNFAPRYYIDLGDSIVQYLSVFGNKNQGLSNLRNVASIVNETEKFFVVGNHDYNSNNENDIPNNISHIFTDKEVFNSIGRCMNGRVVWGSKEKMYYYRDFEDVKLRIIVLNTQDRIMRFNDAGEMISRDPMIYCGVRQEQMDWFANVALDFSDKTDKSEWTTLVYSHIPLSPSYNQSPQVQNDVCVWDIMKAFREGTAMSYSYTDTSEDGDLSISISKDFSEQGKMNLIGNICGHEHRQVLIKDGIKTYGWDYNGIACRVINCGYPYQNQEYLGITHYQKAWTPNGYSLGVTIFNPSKRLFRITYFGYGDDEIINY